MKIILTDFARSRHFGRNSTGTRLPGSSEKFQENVDIVAAKPTDQYTFRYRDGYAPFCRLAFVRNWTGCKVGAHCITPENEQFLRSGYEARTNDELPVLSRWFDGDAFYVPTARYLCLVLYSKEQLALEDSTSPLWEHVDADYGIVAILAQQTENEQPMTPITMMRNAFGIPEGGSGVPLDRYKYAEAVEFWNDHAVVKTEKNENE